MMNIGGSNFVRLTLRLKNKFSNTPKQELEMLKIAEEIKRDNPDHRMVGRNFISLMKFVNPIPDQTQKGPLVDTVLFSGLLVI